MAKLEGKVAFITAGARGQGRSHAVRLAADGADIIVVDICSNIATNRYDRATPEDLAETVRLVEEQDRRTIATQADGRDYTRLKTVLAEATAEVGRLDIVVANAGMRR
jgi:(+)-trans-carveol dehydrogenase